jgi:hypothetical protein
MPPVRRAQPGAGQLSQFASTLLRPSCPSSTQSPGSPLSGVFLGPYHLFELHNLNDAKRGAPWHLPRRLLDSRTVKTRDLRSGRFRIKIRETAVPRIKSRPKAAAPTQRASPVARLDTWGIEVQTALCWLVIFEWPIPLSL